MSNIRRAIQKILKVPEVAFFVNTPYYALWRISQLVLFTTAFIGSIWQILLVFKDSVVRQMFWGRGSLYRASFHLIIFGFTLTVFLAGLVGRLQADDIAANASLITDQGQTANYDLIQQGSSLTAVFAIDKNQGNYEVVRHRVKKGETLAKIAKKYGVSKDTVRWANITKIGYFKDDIEVGWDLLIPEINGVLYKVEDGDNLKEVVALTSGNKFDIIELNSLVPPHYKLRTGQRIFVPNGEIEAPAPPVYAYQNPGGGTYNNGVNVNGTLGGYPAGYFGNPLSNSHCKGYVVTRGYLPWHDGADLAKGGGCPIRSVANGTVTYAGLKGWGSGYTVIINHGNGVESQYLHGKAGSIWVKVGQKVTKGQEIMFMGTTGNSTGIHLHLTLKYKGYTINPRPYIPY